jgi:hypothetical protein
MLTEHGRRLQLWAARAAHIDERVNRAVSMYPRGRLRDDVEWSIRRHAANRWHELFGGLT